MCVYVFVLLCVCVETVPNGSETQTETTTRQLQFVCRDSHNAWKVSTKKLLLSCLCRRRCCCCSCVCPPPCLSVCLSVRLFFCRIRPVARLRAQSTLSSAAAAITFIVVSLSRVCGCVYLCVCIYQCIEQLNDNLLSKTIGKTRTIFRTFPRDAWRLRRVYQLKSI